MDYHIHTHFSFDSPASVESVCQAALALGLQEVAITDHLDLNPLDGGYGYFRPDGYWEAVSRCRAAFAGRLTVRVGLECGEPHLFRPQIETILAAYPYDLVLGSLHWVDGRPTWEAAFFDGLGLDDGLALYFDELDRLAAEGDYDVLAHLDIVRRAAFQRFGLQRLDYRRHEGRLRRVLRTLAERQKGLEVNTSFQRRGMGQPGPPVEVLCWFREEGGQVVTLGSDAHRPDEVGADFHLARAMVREAGFACLTAFERRVANGSVSL